MDIEQEEEYLINQIHDEIRMIRKFEYALRNNPNKTRLSNPIEKALVENEAVKSVLNERETLDFAIVKPNPVEDLVKDMQTELRCLHKEISNLLSKRAKFKSSTASMVRNTQNLRSMMEKTKSCLDSKKKLDIIEKNIKKRFKFEKDELKMVITTLFTDKPDLINVIAQITEHFFSEGADKYMQLEKADELYREIEFLKKIGLIEINPDYASQIRLADLIE